MDVILSHLTAIRPVSLYTSWPTIPLSSFHLSFVPTILIIGLHLTLYFSSLWVSEPVRPPASPFFYPKSQGFPFYPVLAATVSLFASHSAGCCCQHMTLPSKVQQHHKGRFVGICVPYASFFLLLLFHGTNSSLTSFSTLCLCLFLTLRPYSPCFLVCQTPAEEPPFSIGGPQHQDLKGTNWDWTHFLS